MNRIRIAHIVDGRARVGSISSIKRIIRNYDYSDTQLVLVSFGKPLRNIEGIKDEDIYFINLKGVTSFTSFWGNKWEFWHLFMTIIYFICDFVKLFLFAKNNNIKAYHTHLHLDAIFCLLTLFGIKVFVNIRGIVNKKFIGGVGFIIYKYIVPHFATKVIGISEATIKAINIPKTKSIIIYNGLEEKTISQNEILVNKTKDKFIIASVIRFTNGKGIYFLAEIMKEFFLRHNLDDVKFLLIAPLQDDTEQYCKDSFFYIIEKYGLSDKLLYYDSFPDYSYFMPYISCLLHTTLEREGFGNVILEAHWFSKPVVSTPCLGVNDIVVNGKSGFILNNLSAKEAAKCLFQLYSNKKLYNSFSNKANEISHNSKFTIKTNLKKLHELYRSCLQS